MDLLVLVVDESPLMRLAIANALRNEGLPGIRVRTATYRAEALHVLQDHRVDLIITGLHPNQIDHFRPPQNGGSSPPIPVLVVGDEIPARQVEDLLDRGAAGFIARSCSSGILVQVVARHLNLPCAVGELAGRAS